VHDATLDILNVPVFWLPWMILPLRTERQTGFLLPEISYGSRTSFKIGIPFFWAARENVNVTLTPIYSLRRGFKQDVKVETVFGKESSAELFGAFAYDQDVPPNSDQQPFNRERWALIGNQNVFLPGDVRYGADFRFVSDNDYPIDFDELRSHRADRWLESWAWLTRDFGTSGRYGALGVARFADDMQNPDNLDRDGTVLDRLPELSFAALPGRLAAAVPWLTPAFDVDYTEFTSRDNEHGQQGKNGARFLDTGPDAVFNQDEFGFGVPTGNPDLDPHHDDFFNPDHPDPNDPLHIRGGGEGDNRFEEGEPITDQGARFRIYPRLGAPFSLADALEVYPEIGMYETLYTTQDQSFAHRDLPTARLDLRTRLRRRYGELMHVIEPTIGYAYVADQSQRDNPLLAPGTAVPQDRIRSLDLDTVTDDPADRIARANRVTWGAVQRLHESGEGTDALNAELTLLESYDFDKDKFGLAIADGSVVMQRFGTTRVHLGVDPEAVNLSEALVDWRYRHEDGHRIWLGYRYLRDIPNVFEDFGTGERFDNFSAISRIDQLFADLRLQVTQRWQLGYRLSYSFESDLVLQNAGLIEYLSKCGCWSAGIELAEDRASGLQVRAVYRLVGLGNDLARSPLLDALGGL
jgi:lipopolysaccharide assembly outer membrane protein LptD (OstA)